MATKSSNGASGKDADKKPDAETRKEDGDAAQPAFRMVQAPVPVEDSFADGVGGFTVGRNVLKLDLYRVVNIDRESGQEMRAHSHRIVLPLTAIPELANVINQYESAVRQIQERQQQAAKEE